MDSTYRFILQGVEVHVKILRGEFISFQSFLFRHLKLSKTLENSVCYYYKFYNKSDQFLSFKVQMNSYSSNWNTLY